MAELRRETAELRQANANLERQIRDGLQVRPPISPYSVPHNPDSTTTTRHATVLLVLRRLHPQVLSFALKYLRFSRIISPQCLCSHQSLFTGPRP